MVSRRAYPSIPSRPGEQQSAALREATETLTGQRGDGLDKAVTFRDMVDLSFVNYRRLGRGLTFGKIGDDGRSTEITEVTGIEAPTQPQNFSAVGAFRTIILTWDAATFGGYAYTEIWRSASDDFGTAVRIGTSVANVYTDNVDSGEAWYYWIRFTNIANPPQTGPLNDTSGTLVNSAEDPEYIIQQLNSQLTDPTPDTLFLNGDAVAVTLNGLPGEFPFIVGLVDGVPKIALDAATFIPDATITNAKIQTLAADKIYAATGTIADALIGTADISMLMIQDQIVSTNYSANQGFRFTQSTGAAELNQVTIRDTAGNIILSSGGQLSNAIANSAVTLSSLGAGNFATLNQINSGNISTYISSAAIGEAYIANAAVGTLKIAGQAVTIGTSVFNATPGPQVNPFIEDDGLWHTLDSVSWSSTGAPAKWDTTFIVSTDVLNTNTRVVQWRVLLDSAVVYTGAARNLASNQLFDYSGSQTIAPTSGGRTITVQVRVFQGSSIVCSNLNLDVVERKR